MNTSHFKFDSFIQFLVVPQGSLKIIDTCLRLTENDDLMLLLIFHHLDQQVNQSAILLVI